MTTGGDAPDLDTIAKLATEVSPIPATRALVNAVPMCPACGSDVAALTPTCPACGQRSLVLPAQWTWAVGGVYRVRRRLRRHHALCLQSGPEGLTLLLPDGTNRTVAATRELVDPLLTKEQLAGLRCSPGLLLRYAVAHQQDPAAVPWSFDTLVSAALGSARTDPVLGRLTALDALAVNRPDLLEHIGLPEPETHWLRLVHAARRGDAQTVVFHAVALPIGRYRATIAVLAGLLPALRSTPDVDRLASFIHAWTDREPLATLVGRALHILPSNGSTAWADLDLRARRSTLPSALRDQVASLLAPELGTRCPPDLLGRASRRLFAWRYPDSSPNVLRADDLASLDTGTLDEFVDAGVVDVRLVEEMPVGRARAHLRARLDPCRMNDDELDAHPDERRRRAVVSGRPVADDDDSRRRVAAVSALRERRWDDVVVDDLDEPDRPRVRRLLALPEHPEGLHDADLLADRTLWPAIEVRLDDSRRTLTDDTRQRFPEFSAWLDLHRACEHLFLARWDWAATTARLCLEQSTEEPVRREALNVLACALLQRGDATRAMATLDEATDGSHPTALLANIGVTARSLSPQAAAPHLARVAQEAPTTGLRREAVMLALQMWRDDEFVRHGSEENDDALPLVVRDPLRALVADDISSDDFRAVATVLAQKDASWLLMSGAVDRSPHRDTLEAQFVRALAGGLPAFVAFFSEVRDWSSAPSWLVSERDDLVDACWKALVDDLDRFDDVLVDAALAIARSVGGLTRRKKTLISYLAVAMAAGRLSHRGHTMDDGLLDLWRDTKSGAASLPDETVGAAERFANHRVAHLVGVGLAKRVDHCVDAFDAWLEHAQRRGRDENRGLAVLQRCVDQLETVEKDLREWQLVSDHRGVRALYDENLHEVARAIPHVRRMITPKVEVLR